MTRLNITYVKSKFHTTGATMTSFELADLNKLANDCRTEYSKLPSHIDIKLEKELKLLLQQQLTEILVGKGKGQVDISLYSIKFTNKDGLVSIFPSRWLWAASVFYKYSQELAKYLQLVRQTKSKNKSIELNQYPKDLEPASKTSSDLLLETEAQTILTSFDSVNSATNFTLFKKYIYDKKYSYFENEGRKLDRPDAYSSSVLAACQFIAASSDKFIPLVKAFELSEDLRKEFDHYVQQIKNSKTIFSYSATPHSSAGKNIIYYGAPGTGKSHEIDQQTDENNSIRTVFHPETQYSDFIGCLRPSICNDSIEYSFKHGPFIEALVKALNDPSHHYYLIIEEINRAPAAAVFGELFQLLDRDPNGQSKYKIDINDKDLLALLTKELSVPLQANKLYIPENLSIYATMNSSDQAVMPLDTAFKRRWKFEYKPLDFSEAPTGNFNIIFSKDTSKSISWKNFATAVNTILSQEGIPEDRHLGPWFVNVNEIKEPKNAQKTLTGKILMYLWDDVLRHTERSKLFYSDIKTFGSLIKKLENNEVIFSEAFLKKLEEELESNPQNTKDESLKPDGVEEDTAGEN